MFESVAVRPNLRGRVADAGSIAEALLFYNNVNLILSLQSLACLVAGIGIDGFLTLIRETQIKVTCYQEELGVLNHDGVLSLGAFKIGNLDVQRNIETYLYRVTEKRGKSKRSAKQILDLCSFPQRSDDFSPNFTFEGAVFEDIQSRDFLSRGIFNFIRSFAPSYPIDRGHFFAIRNESDKGRPNCFNIDTNIDFEYLNGALRLKFPNFERKITATYLIAQFLHAYGDLVPSMKLKCPIITNEQCGSIIISRVESSVSSYVPDKHDEQLLQEMIFGKGRSVREAVNSGERTISDVIALLDHSAKFKSWISEMGNDVSLVEEYIKSINSVGWIHRLPAKSIRFLTVTGASFLHPGIGIAAGLIDGLLLDSLLKKWTPSVFINGPLMDFVGKANTRAQ